MTRFKKTIMVGVMVITMGAATMSAFAATSTTAGSGDFNFDDYRAQRLELMKDRLEDRVETGIITQAQADAMIAQMEANQALCDGTGQARGAMMRGGYGMMGGGYGMMSGGRGNSSCPYAQ